MSDINTDILSRLERLEKQNRRLRRGLIGMVLGILVLGTVAWKAAEEYYTYEGNFILRDPTGNARGGLTTQSPSMRGNLWIGSVDSYNADGTYQVRPNIRIGFDYDGNPNIWIFDMNGNLLWEAIK